MNINTQPNNILHKHSFYQELLQYTTNTHILNIQQNLVKLNYISKNEGDMIWSKARPINI